MFWYESSSYTLIVLTEHFYLACTEVQLIYPVNAFHLELQTLLGRFTSPFDVTYGMG